MAREDEGLSRREDAFLHSSFADDGIGWFFVVCNRRQYEKVGNYMVTPHPIRWGNQLLNAAVEPNSLALGGLYLSGRCHARYSIDCCYIE